MNNARFWVAAGAVIPLTMDTLSKLVTGGAPTAAAHGSGGFAMIQAADFSWLLDLLTVPFGIAVFATLLRDMQRIADAVFHRRREYTQIPPA